MQKHKHNKEHNNCSEINCHTSSFAHIKRMYHICDYVRSNSYIKVITINHSIIYKQELNQLHCPEPEYGGRKPPNLFFKAVF